MEFAFGCCGVSVKVEYTQDAYDRAQADGSFIDTIMCMIQCLSTQAKKLGVKPPAQHIGLGGQPPKK